MHLKICLFSLIIQILFPVTIFAGNDEQQNEMENLQDLTILLKSNSTINFGISNENSKLPPGDEEEALVDFSFNMYGISYTTLTVHTNAKINFPEGVSLYIFNADIDTTYGGSVSYRVSSKLEDLNLAQFLVERANPSNEGLKLSSVFIVTYTDVPFHKDSKTLAECPETPSRNTFQGILATDGLQSWVIFNYIQLSWGGQMNDDPCTGYSTSISAGFHDFNAGFLCKRRVLNNTAGDYAFLGTSYKELLTKTNIGIPGVIVTRVDEDPTCTLFDV